MQKSIDWLICWQPFFILSFCKCAAYTMMDYWPITFYFFLTPALVHYPALVRLFATRPAQCQPTKPSPGFSLLSGVGSQRL